MREFDGSLSKRLIGHSGPVYSCKFFHPDGQRFLVSVSQDTTARLWSLDLYSCIAVYRGHNLPIWDVDAAPMGAGSYFVTASADRTARLWSTEHIQPLRIFAGHISDVDVVRFHPNGNYVISGSSDRTCRMWDIQNGTCVRLLAGHSRGVSALCVSPDGKHLVSGDKSGQIRVWDLADGRLLKSVQLKSVMKANSRISSLAPYSMEFDRDGKILVTAGADQVVRLFDMSKLLSPSSSTNPDDSSLLAAYLTKQTPIFGLHFTYRNVLLGAGPFNSEE